MKKINLIKIVLTLLISVSALTAHAQWAVSVSAGSADYEFAVTENLTGGETFTDAIDDRFFYRDLGFDYSFGQHQIGFKIGGLSKSNGAIDIRDTSPNASTVETGDAARDEWSAFYTYRTDFGVALTAGYYSSEVETNRAFSANIADLGGGFSGLSATLAQTADKVVDNTGFFLGAAYGRPLSERTGIFVRLGYQDSDADETIDATQVFTIPVQAGNNSEQTANATFKRTAELSGDAIVYGIGGYWAVTDSISLNLFYEVKDFSYSDNATYSDGATFDLDEEQDMFGLTLRYSL